jgi:chromosome segregation ATPase
MSVAFKDELTRVNELLHHKENRVKQLESECNNQKDENQRLDTLIIKKEEALKVYSREVERLKKEIESLKELGQGGSLSSRGRTSLSSTSDYEQMIKDMEDRISKLQHENLTLRQEEEKEE